MRKTGKTEGQVQGVKKRAPLPVNGTLKTIDKPTGNTQSSAKSALRTLK